MEVSCSSIVEVENSAKVQRRGPSASRWKLGGLLGILALCAAAAVLFTLHEQVANKDEQETDLRHMLRQISQNVKGAIHLEGQHNSLVSNESAEWYSEVGQAFSQGGLSLENNEIVVEKAGLYFVYSQASFKVNCHEKNPYSNEQFVHISHAVMRWSESYGSVWKPLLSAVRSACKKVTGGSDNGERWYSAVYLGAVFSLNAGDRLKTTTSPKLLPDMDEEDGKTFFGAFAL
ncbi:tumor necrosis factor a (TNF superfamily, member 2) [Scleropages formosus]|uniref:Tumor necrosis factor n=1 Tax=Scleropages formosus TaxID=113540 RepID=A0A8C9RRD1_SCLFO|nr:tumor necrosis factor-like [Scleropages formosus]